MSEPGPVEVYVALDATHAHAAVAALAAEKVPARVVGENLQTASGELGMSFNALPRVWVAAEYATRAQEILARFDLENATPEAGEKAPPWTCAKCGEEVDSVYAACWKCQNDRPVDGGGGDSL